MTQEQFKEAVELYKQLTEIESVRYAINEGDKLSYTEKDFDKNGATHYYRLVTDCISNIMEKHDKQIRAEIDAEIERIKKEIEKL